MSELINARNARNDLRWRLLTTASTLALIGSLSATPDEAKADDTDRPTLWIELGGQLERQTGQGDAFVPSFVTAYPDSLALKPVSPLHAEKAPLFSNGLDGKITFEPEDTNWVFSASVRYGRSVGHKTFRQSHAITNVGYESFIYPGPGPNGSATPRGYYVRKRNIELHATQFAAAQIAQHQSHAIVDFAAGKDVGLGMFGRGSASDFNIGVRFAQFTSKVSGAMQARPDAKIVESCPAYLYYTIVSRFPSDKDCRAGRVDHTALVSLQSRREFHGIGPALSWNASVPVLGASRAVTLNVDWGANASVLFGRQRASGSHHTYVFYHATSAFGIPETHHTNDGSFDRSKTVVVPNFGGFAGLSFNFANAKVALGYRGDFFFGAMDTGNDTRKTKTVGFYGPFASISVGLGG